METLNTIQVDCTNLSVETINKMASKVKMWQHETALDRNKDNMFFTMLKSCDEFYIRSFDPTKTTITVKEFFKLVK